ncbi:MAG TPA: hypothetical protein VFU46_01915 [Gemmatimonadales bacterium]|nr:hypothetical protein [Gemmatimonadales bacterium]
MWDSVTGRFVDSVVVRSPLPDPLVPVVQWLFQKPEWVMVGGIVLAAIVALALLVFLWPRRRAIVARLATPQRGVKLALAGAVGVLLLLAGTGVKAYDFMMHDNDFCAGCHIFVPSGQVFVRPDTGTYLLVNKQEGKHDTLECHACHPFSIKRQTKTLVAWMVARPDEVPPHGKVPRDICEQCHVTGPAKDTWKRITTTAGHRTHLEPDSLVRKGVACLTCHARTAHRFQPADTTCAQQGCHFTDSIRIQLGRMTARFDPGQPLPNEEQLYCNSCHQFTADAQFLAPDSALGLLRPSSRQCFTCHEMRTLLVTFDPAREPHGGSCGMCHNPHTDPKPVTALKSCVDAQCHADWRDVEFHTGASHRKVAERCETCHESHSARVDASNCVGCHKWVRYGSKRRLRPPLPFDTTEALRQTSWRQPSRGLVVLLAGWRQGVPPPQAHPRGSRPDVSASPSDTFPHERHSRLACLTCHDLRAKGRRLTFEAPRGCQICHHQRPAKADCAACHQADELAATRPVQMAVAVPRHDRRRRTVQFNHAAHDTLACTSCHVTPVTLAPADSVRTCAGCHEKHHAQSRDCAACHRTARITPPHELPVQAHVACDACHTPATVARLVPTRSFCLACHKPQQDHYPPRECSACHFQRSPAELQPKLHRGGAPT